MAGGLGKIRERERMREGDETGQCSRLGQTQRVTVQRGSRHFFSFSAPDRSIRSVAVYSSGPNSLFSLLFPSPALLPMPSKTYFFSSGLFL